ncbi:MAG: GH3 auxin-responsive promoter family protein [Muribaculaceae bacterium]|nr:GH3 auxin-responsive promoter family protein [Muribaculaceae bacterium]
MNLTGIARKILSGRTREVAAWRGREEAYQQRLLADMLRRAQDTEFGRSSGFADILGAGSAPAVAAAYAEAVPLREYEDFRPAVMKMIEGARGVLWPGVCRNFAQSSGTTGGRSKYIPITEEGLRANHYRGASYSVALYLHANPGSRMFAGKGLILGGSFANNVVEVRKGTVVGDLSATLIQRIYPMANWFRVPDKHTALLEDWEVKLPLIAEKAAAADITNISGVPSWMMRVLLRVLEDRGATSLKEVWPNLEVFFHGGISFAPYREEYRRLCDGLDMHYSEVYNASEGYFAVSDNTGAPGMVLLVDSGVYYEFLPLGSETAIGAGEVEPGKVYELIVSTVNGLWRYRTGDTVRVETLSPLRITVAGRTKSFINAFGEELMEDNAERAMAEACRATGASVHNYTVAPVYAHGTERGRHQWLVEWKVAPADPERFVAVLDATLRSLNSDYDAKRSHDIFLDLPEVTAVAPGAFDRWLATSGSGKLGGQRKVPRLSNDRKIADAIVKSGE